MKYTNWEKQIFQKSKGCAYMDATTGKWKSENCDAGSTTFICQKDATGHKSQGISKTVE